MIEIRGRKVETELIKDFTVHEFKEFFTTKKPYRDMQVGARKEALDVDYKEFKKHVKGTKPETTKE